MSIEPEVQARPQRNDLRLPIPLYACDRSKSSDTNRFNVHINLDHNGKMPMTEMHLGDQTVRYDREATVAIYAGLKGGWAEDCMCVGCRNLMVQRDVVYPSAFRELLDRLGIDPNKEGEAVADGPLKDGLHHYGGWFFFVGEMVTAGEHISQVSDSPCFAYFFTQRGPCPREFRGGPHLGIEFAAHIKWILNERWDSDLRVVPATNAPEERT